MATDLPPIRPEGSDWIDNRIHVLDVRIVWSDANQREMNAGIEEALARLREYGGAIEITPRGVVDAEWSDASLADMKALKWRKERT